MGVADLGLFSQSAEVPTTQRELFGAILRDLLERGGVDCDEWPTDDHISSYSNTEMFEALGEALRLNPVTIPAGTEAKRCLGCDDRVYWIPRRNGYKESVSIKVEFGRAPTAERDGTGILHLGNCRQSAWRDTQG
jgi:hypothetical protein